MNTKFIAILALTFITVSIYTPVQAQTMGQNPMGQNPMGPPPMGSQPPPPPLIPVYKIENVVGDLYRAMSDGHVSVFLVTSEGTILADPLNLDFANWLKKEIAERFDSTVRYVLYTHHHWDHASGGAAFADTAEFVGHENMIPGLELPLAANYIRVDANKDNAIQRDEAYGGLAIKFDKADADGDGKVTGAELSRDVVPPTITFSDKHSVYLGGKEVQLIWGGENHSDDGSIIYFPEEAAGFGADWLLINTFPRALYGAKLDTWVEIIDRMLSLNVTHVIAGHDDRGTQEDLENYGQLFRDLRTAVRAAIEAGVSQEEFAQSISLPAYSEWNRYDTLAAIAAEGYALELEEEQEE